MSAPVVVYFGPGDLRALMFRQYLSKLGAIVHIARSRAELTAATPVGRPVIRVIASDKSAEELVELVAWIRRHTGERYPILILGKESYSLPGAGVEVIPPPNLLSRAVERVQHLIHGEGSGLS